MSDNFMRKTPGAPAGDAIGWIEITPKGIERLGRNPFDQIGKIAVFAKQAAYLAGWTMTERTFGRFLGAAWIVLDPTLQAIVLFLTLSWIFNIRGDDVSFLSIYLSVTLWRPTLNLVTIAPTLLVSRATILQQTNFPVLLILLETVIYELYLVGLNFIIVAILLLFAGKLESALGAASVHFFGTDPVHVRPDDPAHAHRHGRARHGSDRQRGHEHRLLRLAHCVRNGTNRRAVSNSPLLD